ncbi:uncharacterized protein LOC135206885 isoform X1 [Macrobrachium nipponense]|uniref:uncharacterized protein LOC135206885 isoform X1 n=3 Tax=Macrobrachium nipponense TaxID=159736 RepID=UPI0030C8276A
MVQFFSGLRMRQLFSPFTLSMVLVGFACGGPFQNSGGSLNSLFPHHSKSKEDDSRGFNNQRRIATKKLVKCSGHGLQPSKDNCRTFYHCVDLSEHGLHWLAFRFTCPKGMFFDRQAKDCFWLDRRNSQYPQCTRDAAAEEGVTFYPGDKLENSAALVVNSDFETNSCEHIISEASLFSTSVSGYKRDIEFILKEMPEICHAVANASNSLHEIKAKQFLIVPPSETIMFRNISLEYNRDLLFLQQTVDALIGNEGILKSLNRILLLVKDFEISFRRELLKDRKPAEAISKGTPLLRSTEEAKEEFIEVAKNVKTCLNFSAYGYSSQAIMTFLVDDLSEHASDPETGETEDYVMSPMEEFFQYVYDVGRDVLIDAQYLQIQISDFLKPLWESYSDFRNYRITAVGAIGHLHKEKLQSLAEIDKTKSEVAKISDELQSKLSYLSLVPEPRKSSGSFFDSDRDMSIRVLVNLFHDIWNVVQTREYPLPRRFARLRTRGQMQHHKDQVIQMNAELKRLNGRILMLERDIPVLEEEMLRLQGLEDEARKLLNDSYWLVSGVVRMLSVLREIENIFTAVVRTAQGDISKARTFRSGSLRSVTRLHLYMAIENLKWNWNHVSRDMDTLEGCGAHK